MPVTDGYGTKLHYQQLGTSGSPVVMLHGLLLGSVSTWYFGVAPRLAKRHRVTAYDLRGHGMSERPAAGYDLDTMAHDLQRMLEREPQGRAAVVGHSFGGAVALRHAILYPGKIESMVLVDTPLPVFSSEWNARLLSGTAEDVLDMLTPVQRDLLSREGGRESRLVRQIRGLLSETSLVADLARQPDIGDQELSSIDCSVLLVYGSESEPLAPSRERLSQALRGARLELVPGGHWLPFEAPEKIFALSEEFLRE